MIHPWEVVGVLVPLCGASGFVGFRYARDLTRADAIVPAGTAVAPTGVPQPVDAADAAPARVVPITEPLRAPAGPALTGRVARKQRDVVDDDFVDLHERLGPWGRRSAESGSDVDAEDDRGSFDVEIDVTAISPRAASQR